LKNEFIMMASHELRTPLTSIGMSIGLLQEKAVEKLNDNERELLLVAFEESQRLKTLVNELLDLSRIESGSIEMDLKPVHVKSVFEKVLSVFKTQAEEKSLDLSYLLSENLPDIKADVEKITLVLINLISNAFRYTENGGYINLKAEHIGQYVHISVKDNGGGIPYEYQSRIFDKFFHLNDTKIPGGSGLGLAISKEIVHAHGGTIWVESEFGKGSMFIFTVPII
jgi:two-component system, NtrC family, sensor histidine kinase KinB